MAAKATKKPVTKSKLKASQKKKVNKWLIVGGVAAVAIIGALVVRFSSAAKWYPVYTHVSSDIELRSKIGKGPVKGRVTMEPIQLRTGRNYRYCVTGYGDGGDVNTKIGFNTYPSSTNPQAVRTGVAESPKGYSGSLGYHCSAAFKTIKSYWVRGYILWLSGKPMTITKMTIEELR